MVLAVTRGGEFVVAAGSFDPLRGFKRRSKPLTTAQREALSERLAENRPVSPRHADV